MISIASGMYVYPAAYIRMDGATYLDEWNWKLPPGSGPYEIRSEDIKKGRSITLHRREAYWQGDFPENKGGANFDEIEWQIVRDQELMYQKMLAGELDMYRVGRAQRWVDELDREKVIQMGWVQKRKIYNKVPQGLRRLLLQPALAALRRHQRAPRLRASLQPREALREAALLPVRVHEELLPWRSPGLATTPSGSGTTRRRRASLLAESGWTKRDDEGFLVNDKGERFPVLKLEYGAPSFQRIFEVPKHDLWNEAGIKMELKVLDYASLLKKVWDYKFQLVYWSWTASLFPDPIQQFHSKYADPKQTNNLNGFKNDGSRPSSWRPTSSSSMPQKRLAMMQRLDEILFDVQHLRARVVRALLPDHLLGQVRPPAEYQARSTRDWINIMHYWWYEPERAKRTMQNKKDGVPNYPDSAHGMNQYDDPERRWWLENDLPMPKDAMPEDTESGK